MKKYSITLLVAVFSLLIIGFGGAVTAAAAGECAETQLANGASESTAVTNCRGYEADAARYAAIQAFYTNEVSNVERAFKADSTYQAANPELMTSHRFVAADGSATAASAPGAIESQSSLNLYPNYAPGHLGH